MQILLARIERSWIRWTGGIARRNGSWARRVRWPLTAFAPFRRRELHLARRGALGDVLMCTPALRDLHRVNPDCRVTFYTDYPEFIRGLPGVDSVCPYSQRSPRAIELIYETSIPPQRHIAQIFGDCIGVNVQDVQPSCQVDAGLAEQWRARLRDLPRPVVALNRCSGPFTPNKDWPDAYWCELLELLLPQFGVVETGTAKPASSSIAHGNYVDLRGQTSVADLVAVMRGCDAHVGPMTGPVHIAAALRIPSVVIYGGYEHPVCSQYAGNMNLFTALPCSPCWLADHCPFDLKCLRQIRPGEVAETIRQLLDSQ